MTPGNFWLRGRDVQRMPDIYWCIRRYHREPRGSYRQTIIRVSDIRYICTSVIFSPGPLISVYPCIRYPLSTNFSPGPQISVYPCIRYPLSANFPPGSQISVYPCIRYPISANFPPGPQLSVYPCIRYPLSANFPPGPQLSVYPISAIRQNPRRAGNAL